MHVPDVAMTDLANAVAIDLILLERAAEILARMGVSAAGPELDRYTRILADELTRLSLDFAMIHAASLLNHLEVAALAYDEGSVDPSVSKTDRVRLAGGADSLRAFAEGVKEGSMPKKAGPLEPQERHGIGRKNERSNR